MGADPSFIFNICASLRFDRSENTEMVVFFFLFPWFLQIASFSGFG